jgi:Outer membrane protein beta-barrel domain
MNVKMKTILTFSVLALLAIRASAQRSAKNDFEKENFFRIGFNAGLNVNKIQARSFRDQFSYDYSLRGFLQFNVARKWGIQPEVTFQQASSEKSSDFSDIYDDVSLNGSQLKAKLDYLKLGSMFNLNIGPTQRIKFQAGPQWGLLVHEAVDSLNTPRTIFKKADFSLAAGLMFQLPFVHVGGRFEQGLVNINDIDNRDRWRSQAFQFFAGVTF